MVLRLAVFWMCSYWQSRRLWRLFRSPVAWAAADGLQGGFGGWLLPDQAREGVAEKGPVLPRIGGRVFPHILCSPPWTFGGWRKTGRVVLCNPGLKLSGACAWLSKLQVFIKLVLNWNCGILRIGRTIRITVMMRGCSRCLAARRKRAAGRAAETWEARCRAGSHPAPPAKWEISSDG